MELYEEELEMYNSKLRLLNWLYEELQIQDPKLIKELNEEGQKLPLNR